MTRSQYLAVPNAFDTPAPAYGLSGSFNEAGELTVSWDADLNSTLFRALRRPSSSTGSSDEQIETTGTTATFSGPFTSNQDVWIESINEQGNGFTGLVTIEFPIP
jgi:hypothetical protein